MLNNGLRMIFRLFLNNSNRFINSNCINREPIIEWINTWTWIDKQQWKIRLIVFPYTFFIIVVFVWWFKKVCFFFKSFNSMRKARLSNCDKNFLFSWVIWLWLYQNLYKVNTSPIIYELPVRMPIQNFPNYKFFSVNSL